MKAQDIRKLTKDQIEKKISDLKEELFNLRFQASLGNLEKPARMNEVKKDIARMKTILTEGSYNKEDAPKKRTRAKKAVEETSNGAE
ncbi:MAG: 50S ribosomal protein L29 [Anaeroplasmataceae bacterium]|nr:50S ribosomal protein L29 [Anaeroplasmataceae bacterium]